MAFAAFDEENKIVHCVCLFVPVRAHGFIPAAGASDVTAKAVTEPKRERAPTTPSAGRKPLRKVSVAPNFPNAPKTAEATAIAKTLPKRCRVLLTPDALPMSAGGTAESVAVAATGIAMEMPKPIKISGDTSAP